VKVYLFRNTSTNQEVKTSNGMKVKDIINSGYELIKTIDLSVSEKEKKAK
jgi:hypothetical protein